MGKGKYLASFFIVPIDKSYPMGYIAHMASSPCNCKGNPMKHSRHTLRYVDFYPEPVEREPSTLAIIAGACLALTALWIVCIVAFSF